MNRPHTSRKIQFSTSTPEHQTNPLPKTDLVMHVSSPSSRFLRNQLSIDELPEAQSREELASQFFKNLNAFRKKWGVFPLHSCTSLKDSSLLDAMNCARTYSVDRNEIRSRVGLQTVRIRTSDTATGISKLFDRLVSANGGGNGEFRNTVLDMNMFSAGVSIFGTELCYFIVLKMYWSWGWNNLLRFYYIRCNVENSTEIL